MLSQARSRKYNKCLQIERIWSGKWEKKRQGLQIFRKLSKVSDLIATIFSYITILFSLSNTTVTLSLFSSNMDSRSQNYVQREFKMSLCQPRRFLFQETNQQKVLPRILEITVHIQDQKELTRPPCVIDSALQFTISKTGVMD